MDDLCPAPARLVGALLTGPELAGPPVLDLPPPAVSDPQPVRRRDRVSDRDDLG
ncbi:MAG: hypothetical protein LH469_10115 [Frankiaceae bacterium]|nr:hypothetical protein [Frankiaceae bacterium]